MSPPILCIALPKTTKGLFDYLPPHDADFTQIKQGMRIKVPFRSRELIGLIVDIKAHSEIAANKLKKAIAIIDQESVLPDDLFKLCSWSAGYYHFPLSDTLLQAMPLLLRKGVDATEVTYKNKDSTKMNLSSQDPLPLNQAQQQAFDTIIKQKNAFHVFLLDGVTGSGKTEVYLQVIAEKLVDQQQILVLLPEISLTPQTIERFRKRFPDKVSAFHSNMSAKEKLTIWQQVKTNTIRIVIGTRSALFLPFATLSLIIIDEEHDPSFKQQERLRYHARDLAIVRGKLTNIPVILGSATPSLETVLNAKRKRYSHLMLPERAGNALMPAIQLIDLNTTKTHEGIALPLLTSIKEALQQGNQVMLFLNRRGFAPVTYCTHCKHVQACHACDSKLVYHNNPPFLQCHHCEAKWPFPTPCQLCHENCLVALGTGTQRLEETLNEYFKDIPIYRIDRDTTKKKTAMQTMFDAMHEGKPAILLGTQMLAKGHHFPKVTLVGIIDIDSSLLSGHFRAREHIGQLLLQVAGRAGRADHPGNVYIQTLQPTHPLLTILTQSGYSEFADYLLKERELAALPPYTHFALLSAEAKVAKNARKWLEKIKRELSQQSGMRLCGPTTASMAKRRGFYREQLIIQADKRAQLQKTLNELRQLVETASKKSIRFTLDVDPIDLD